MRPVSAATLMLSSGASAFTSVVRPPVGNTMPRMSVVPRMQVPATLDDARVRTVCVALMGQYPKIEDMLESGGLELSELDFDGFSGLVETLEVQCTEPDKRAIFKMIDVDGSKTIDASELKDALRMSGAITGMYDDSLRTFGLLIAATLAFDAGIFFFQGGTAAFDFLTAYVVEDSLSVDNLFVFLLIFRYFKVPPQLVQTLMGPDPTHAGPHLAGPH